MVNYRHSSPCSAYLRNTNKMIAIPIASLHPIAGVGSILGTLNALSVNPIGGAVHVHFFALFFSLIIGFFL